AVTERLGTRLQPAAQRFESAPRLHFEGPRKGVFVVPVIPADTRMSPGNTGFWLNHAVVSTACKPACGFWQRPCLAQQSHSLVIGNGLAQPLEGLWSTS